VVLADVATEPRQTTYGRVVVEREIVGEIGNREVVFVDQ
jgi:hypothetical protein